MANTKSSAKRARQSLKKQTVNRRNRSVLKTAVKGFTDVASSKALNKETASERLLAAIRALDKAATKGAIPKNRSARKISRITKAYNALVAKA